MPAKKTAVAATKATTPVFDISQFREQKRYVTREIDREGTKPLTVKLEDLSIRQTNEIPWGMKVPLKESMEVCAQYVAEWDLEAENIATGDLMSVPPPSEAGWEVFELVENSVAVAIINWLKIPHYMKAQAEKPEAEEGKKSSTASTSTSEDSSDKS